MAAAASLRQILVAENAWLVIFLPALISYIVLLKARVHSHPAFGTVERLHPDLDAIIGPNAVMEVLATGFLWAEGPQWVTEDDRSFIVFSDTKKNKIYRWEEGTGFLPIGKSLYLDRSGCRGEAERCTKLLEPGSNGLTLEPGTDLLVMCQHGERRIVRRELNGTFTPLATHYQGRRLNSPNDLVYSSDGSLYFTDPPYGLNGKEEDPERELNVSGVYRVPAESLQKQTTLSETGSPDVQLVYGELKRPNGLAFSPDSRKLYVANSDGDDPLWMLFHLDERGEVINSSLWKSARPFQQGGSRTGNPDGLKVDASGNLFATGPGGVLIFSAAGTHLGTLLTGKKTGNVAFGKDGYLYICAADVLGRIKLG